MRGDTPYLSAAYVNRPHFCLAVTKTTPKRGVVDNVKCEMFYLLLIPTVPPFAVPFYPELLIK